MTNQQLVALIAGQRDTALHILDACMLTLPAFTMPLGKDTVTAESSVGRARQIVSAAGLDPDESWEPNSMEG